MIKRFLTGCLLAGATLSAAAQAWPTKPIKLVVAYPPGGVSDSVARTIADKLSPGLGVPVVIDNKAGASGAIGVDAIAKSAPDGYTVGFSAVSPLALSPHLGKLPFDPKKDLVPVVSVMYSPVLLLATPATDAKDFKSLMDAARSKPGAVRWSTSGPASLGHIMLEQLKSTARVDITHVPYRGGGQMITDAMGGQFEILSINSGPAIVQQVKAGKLRALAVGAPARMDSLPQVPTLAELGFAAANMTSTFGIFAPAGTPAAIIERFNAQFNKVLAMPDVRAKLIAADNVPTGGTAAAFANQIAQESENNARIIRQANIKAE
ncbi:MAG: transporter substrate-binding protein [Ramlibacter sp.]|nr:transporter substrate-binding protein [Ramlibacter sp.]